jgi:hypothetical protein
MNFGPISGDGVTRRARHCVTIQIFVMCGRTCCTVFTGIIIGAAITIAVTYPVLRDEWFGPGDDETGARAAFVACSDAGTQSPADVSEGALASGASILPTNAILRNVSLMTLANVHYHSPAEHRSQGEFSTPNASESGFACDDASDATGTARVVATNGDDVSDARYAFSFCQDVAVGDTIELHWVYSTGAARTGVSDGLSGAFATQNNPYVVVRAQVFKITNNPSDDVADLLVSWNTTLVSDAVRYVGSTTGDKYDNVDRCSPFLVIWHVDRECHRVSARSLDEMCRVMKDNGLSDDLKAHAARQLVPSSLTASALSLSSTFY